MRRFGLLLGSALLIGAVLIACSDDDGDVGPTSGPGSDGAYKIGALLPLTGSLSSNGEASRAALEAARDAINEDAALKIELVVKDTETNGEAALSALEELHEEGVRLVIGPYASSSVAAVKDFAETNGVVLISPLSTARSLAVAGDNVYRYTPDDAKEGEALAAILRDDGIENLITLSRDDPGNLGLQAGLKTPFEANGGVIADGITYAADEDNFEDVVTELVGLLEANPSSPGATGVYLTAFGEVTQLFEAARANGDPLLTQMRWYGSDSVALSRELIANDTAAAFAVEVRYPNPILGLRDEDSALWEPVMEALEDELNRTPDSFALAAYDALVVAHMALEAAGADADASTLGAAFVAASANHVGLTGPTVLNDAGDRDGGSYDFWSVCRDGSDFVWVRTISFVPATEGVGTISRYDC